MVLRDYVKAVGHWLTAPAGATAEGKALPTLELKRSDAMVAAMFTRVGIEQYAPRKYRELVAKFRTNPIVRRATKLCAEAVAAITPVVKVNGKEDDRASKIVSDFLKKPNPNQDRFGFVRDLAAFEKLSGNGWVEGNTGVTRDYLQAYALRPDRMIIKPGEDGWPALYGYRAGAGREKWWRVAIEQERAQILHVKDFSADDDLFGAGALEAAELPLRVYENAQFLASQLLDNGAVMNGALVYKPNVPAGSAYPTMTPEQRTQLQELLEKRRLNKKDAGKPMVMPAALEWVNIATNMVDLQAEEIRRSAARDIVNAFGVPSLLLGLPGDNTYANFTEASRAFYRNTVMPDWQRIFGALARWLSQLLAIPGLEFELDEDELWALAEELALRAQRIEGSSVLSIEEKREALGWDRVPPPEDTLLLPGGLVSIDDILNADLGIYGDRSEAAPAAAGKKSLTAQRRLLLPKPGP